VLALASEEHRARGARLRWFGIDRELRKPSILGEAEWNVKELGYKYQMNDIAAAVALGNLGHLGEMLAHRRKNAAVYRDGLAGVPGLTLLENRLDRESAYWLFTVLVERREDFLRRLKERGANASVVHLRIDRNDLYGGERRDLPDLDRFTEMHVSLPIHEGISFEDAHCVVESIRQGW
jgi:perosamine synthetase